MILFGILYEFLIYLEIIYHVGCFGFTGGNPVFMLALLLIVASLEALLIGKIKEKWKKRIFWVIVGIEYLLYAAQFVYMSIFKQPLQIEMAVKGGGDALTNYWREALTGIMEAMPFLVLMAAPLIVIAVLLYRKRLHFPDYHNLQVLRMTVAAGMGLIASVVFLMIGKYIGAGYYEEYTEFFDPLTVTRELGVVSLVQRDAAMNLESLAGSIWDQLTRSDSKGTGKTGDLAAENQPGQAGVLSPSTEPSDLTGEEVPDETQATEPSGGEETEPAETQETQEPEEKPLDTSPHEFPIDWEKLAAEADNKEEKWLAEYMPSQTPTKKNEYTGLFEGYNLIFLTAEGFSPYAVREDITPTLYHLTHSGFVFTNYYVPLWSTSTSDGEYVNLTGLVPDGQHSMRKSGANDMAFSLPRFFARRGVGSMAYHDNTMDYYSRNISHNNLGYIFKASKLGKLSREEWGQYLFPLEHSTWPSSDLEMMQSTMPEWVTQESFNIYYMTVSGHMNYSFTGNYMSSKNRDAVAGLDMSENARAYIACHVEVDKALEYLLEQLKAAGQLEKTVICMSADHYPYAMEQSQLDELAGKRIAENLDIYRNNLILWHVGMEDEPIIVDKVCGAMDLLPTLLNLFGFEYDSRLFAGKDIFSDEEGMVIFKDRSFITDNVIYDRTNKKTVWRMDLEEAGIITNDIAGYVDERGVAGIYADYEAAHGVTADGSILRIPSNKKQLDTEEARDQYLEESQQDMKNRWQFSADILRNDYYHAIMGALPEEYQNSGYNPAIDWIPAELPPADEGAGASQEGGMEDSPVSP